MKIEKKRILVVFAAESLRESLKKRSLSAGY